MMGTAVKPWWLQRDFLLTLVLIGAMVLGLTGLAAATGWEESFASLEVLGTLQILALLALAGANYAARGFRWWMYCRVLRIPVAPLQSLRHYLGGFALTVTPGRVGEFIRLRWIRLETGVGPIQSAPVVLMDRAADLAAIGLLIGVSLVFSTIGLGAGLPVAALCLALAVIVTRAGLLEFFLMLGYRILNRWERLFAKARKAARSMAPFSEWRIVLPALALGGFGWAAEGVSFWLLLDWMGQDVALWTAIGIFLIASVTGGATGAPGGIGGAEAVMVGLLSLQGVPLSVSIPATAVIRLTTLWFAIAIGLVAFPLANRLAQKGPYATQP